MSVAVPPCLFEQPLIIDERHAEKHLLAKIAGAMEQTGYQPLRRIDLRYDAGTVILRGLVPTYLLKQMAQVAAMSVSGVGQIDNQLRVPESFA